MLVNKINVAAPFVSSYTIRIVKNFEGIIILIIGVVAACVLFFGLITAVKKSFSVAEPEKIDSSQSLQEQQQRSKDIMDKQKRLMEDQRQRLRDMQRR